MIRLNKVDEEIIQILREAFLSKVGSPLASDHATRIWMLRACFYTALLSIFMRVTLGLAGREVTAEMSVIYATPIAYFFGLLFIHINNESENTSILVFALTWLSITVGLYV